MQESERIQKVRILELMWTAKIAVPGISVHSVITGEHKHGVFL